MLEKIKNNQNTNSVTISSTKIFFGLLISPPLNTQIRSNIPFIQNPIKQPAPTETINLNTTSLSILQTTNTLWPKMEFTHFEGKQPQLWVRKCQKIFQIYNIPKEHQVELAAMFLDDKLDVQFKDWKEGRSNLKWDEFVIDLCNKFTDYSEANVVEEFHRLRKLLQSN